jgi:hypothetical protein
MRLVRSGEDSVSHRHPFTPPGTGMFARLRSQRSASNFDQVLGPYRSAEDVSYDADLAASKRVNRGRRELSVIDVLCCTPIAGNPALSTIVPHRKGAIDAARFEASPPVHRAAYGSRSTVVIGRG